MDESCPGYYVDVPCNGTFAYLDRTDVGRCLVCDMLLTRPPLLPGVVLEERGHALSRTLDGMMIAGEELVCAYRLQGLSGLQFTPLPDDASYYAVSCDRSLAFDYKRRKTAFVNKCTACRQYEQVVGSTPVMLLCSPFFSDDGFFITDLAFGLGDSRHPLLLAGARASEMVHGLDPSIRTEPVVGC